MAGLSVWNSLQAYLCDPAVGTDIFRQRFSFAFVACGALEVLRQCMLYKLTLTLTVTSLIFCWCKIESEIQTVVNSLLQYQQMLFEPSATEHDVMAALSYREYLLQVERNPTAFSGRRVLAAVLMKSPSSEVTVLSLGTGETGTMCLQALHMSSYKIL